MTELTRKFTQDLKGKYHGKNQSQNDKSEATGMVGTVPDCQSEQCQKGEKEVTDIYRGFEIKIQGFQFLVFEGNRKVHVAKSETAAYDWIDAELRKRRAEDQADATANHRR